MRAQLWLWFIGMIVLTLPWHYVGILGMPRRMAFYDYSNPEIAAQAFSVDSLGDRRIHSRRVGVLFFIVLIRGHRGERIVPEEFRFSVAVHSRGRFPSRSTASRCGSR